MTKSNFLSIAPRDVALALLATIMGAGLARAGEPVTTKARLVAIADRKPALAFQLEDASGKSVRLAGYRGSVVVVNFWATECAGCVYEIPSFIEIAHDYKNKKFAVLGVSEDIPYEDLESPAEAWSKVKPFVKKKQLNYAIVMGDRAVTKAYNIDALPLTLLVDKRGRIAASYLGIVNRENLEQNIQAVLGERGN